MLRLGRHGVAHRVDGTFRIRILVAIVATLAVAGLVTVLAPPAPSQAGATTSVSTSWIGIAALPDGGGYWVTSNKGAVEPFGNAVSHGDIAGITLNQPIVGMAATPDGGGYWLDAADGGIFTFGNARFWGSTGSLRLNKPIVGMAGTHDGGGYWLVASDGGIFAFGDAAFEGSMGSHHLNARIVGMAPTHDGRGYWLVASDGGIFAFGDAAFEGSLGSSPPASPIANMTPTPDNNGYWLLRQDGTVYGFGDASIHSSARGGSAPATSLAATPSNGYWVLTADGAVHPFGDAPNYGSPAIGPVASSPPPSKETAASPPSTPSGGPGGGGSSGGGANPVSIRALTPSSGTAGGGDTIDISGSGFTDATAVDFGSDASSAFTVTSATTVTAVAPAGAGTVNVQVVTPAGTSSESGASRFTYNPTGQPLITAQGQHLELDGLPYTFTGVNAYEIGTEVGVNPGCGGQESDAQLNELFSSLPPNSLVRFWAFQDAIATNVHTDQLDWGPLDRVFAAAAAHGQRLIVTLTDQGGVCDGDHWQDPSWFDGGFMDVFDSPSNSDGSGHTPLSYWQYMQDVVNRYKNSPALGMWEPISEAEASSCDGSYYPGTCWGHTSCPDEAVAAAALRHFFDVVGTEIHTLDPNHLVENGLLGGGQCGTEGTDYDFVSASPGIDVLSYHDYYSGTPMGGDQWNGIAMRIAQAAALGKPIIAGEMGLDAGTVSGCMTRAARSTEIEAKIQAQMNAGTSGVLIWDWLPAPSGPCNTDTFPGDPLMAVVAAGPPST